MREVHRRMSAVAASFPVLEGTPGTAPFDPIWLDNYLAHGPACVAEEEAGRFLLNLWDSEREWRSGRFNLGRAMRARDHHQRAAFQAWAREPFLP